MMSIIGREYKCLDHGFIRVVDIMGNDAAIVQAARVSYGSGTKSVSTDANLINYLMRMWHTSPFESCEIKLHIKLPIFVARQWIRHRTACLAANSLINTSRGKLSMEHLYKLWPIDISVKHLNEDLLTFTPTKVTDIWGVRCKTYI